MQPSSSRIRWWGQWGPYAAGVAALAVLLALLAAASLYRERVRQHERARDQTHTTAVLLERAVAGLLGRADAHLLALVDEVAQAASPDDRQARLDALQGRAARVAPEVTRWQWCITAGTNLPAGGRVPACAADLPAPGSALHVAGPLRQTPQGPWSLVLSRPWLGATGQAAGWVSAELPLDRFDVLFRALQLGPQGAATLRMADLALVHRRPWPAAGASAVGSREVSLALKQALAAAPQRGEFDSATALDGVLRINAYQRVAGYPMVVLVGLPASNYPRGWNRLDASVLTLAAATVLMAAVAALLLYRSSQRRVEAATRQFEALVASSNDAIASKTLDGIVTSWNGAAERIFGWPADAIIGQPMRRLFPPECRDEEDEILARVQRGESVTHFDTERLHAQGHRLSVAVTISPVRDAQGRIVGASMIARDITHQKALEAELRSLAFHDPLTRLPNRRLLLDRLCHAQETSRRSQSYGAVLFIDLDHFKQLNDRYGHDVGDQMLVEVAQRLRAAVREADTVARLGGDEFVVLCEQLGHDLETAHASVVHLAAKLGEALSGDCTLGELRCPCAASVGLRLFFGTEDDADGLLRDADQAMYRDKERRHTDLGALTI